MSEPSLRKYPRTPHVAGSQLQPGDEDLDQVPVHELAGTHLVVEEKVDGANVGISFDRGGHLRLQSRGHVLTGGPRERQFDLFKQWAARHRDELWARLGPRLVCYGEWTYAKHTVFYDRLPAYFLEFDVLDTDTGSFLDTPARRELFAGSAVHQVPVLHQGPADEAPPLPRLVVRSRFKGAAWRDELDRRAVTAGLDPARVRRQTDPSDDAEGLYLKVEAGGIVQQRLKWVRASFTATVMSSDEHWLDRPILANGLAAPDDLGPDAGPDQGPDQRPDAGPDAGHGTVPDAGPDTGNHAGHDAGHDDGPDAGRVAGSRATGRPEAPGAPAGPEAER